VAGSCLRPLTGTLWGKIVQQTISGQTTAFPPERRSHPRLKLSSIIYVEVGSGNGGVILNLGINGLSFQAVGRLNGETEVTVKFRLPNSGPTVEAMGTVAWMGPTSTEAGIAFKQLPGDTQQNIADWMGKEAEGREIPPPRSQQHRQTPAVATAKPILPPVEVAPDPVTTTAALESAAATQQAWHNPAPAEGVSHETPSANLRTAPPEPIEPTSHEQQTLVEPPSSEQRSIELGEPARGSPLAPAPAPAPEPAPVTSELAEPLPSRERSRDASPIQIRNRIEHLRWPVAPSQDAVTVKHWNPSPLVLAQRQAARRRKILLVCSAGCAVILMLTLVFASTRRAAPAAAASPQQSAPDPGATPQVAPGLDVPSQALQTTPPPDPGRDWTTILREAFLGSDSGKKTDIDQGQASIQVWISTGTGYYYCHDSPFFQTLQPGAMMTQGEALQTGYQPKLGAICR